MREAPSDPFQMRHQKYVFDEHSIPQYSFMPDSQRVRMGTFEGCDKNLVGRYGYVLSELGRLGAIRNLRLMVYPGTICEVNGKKSIFSVLDDAVFAPGIVRDDIRNEDAYIKVVAMANLIQCLLSVEPMRHGGKWATPQEVVETAKMVFNDMPSIAQEIKIFFELVS